jgi:hypothetical protein
MTESSPSRAACVSRLTRLALAASIAVVGAFAVTGTAHADTATTLPGGTYCKFDVIQTTLKDNTKVIENASGIHSTGNFVVQWANPANGKSVTRNVSGATKTSISGGILTATFTGPSFIDMGPGGQSNTGQPGIVYSPGRTVATVNLNLPQPTVLTFSATAPVTNVCALLA